MKQVILLLAFALCLMQTAISQHIKGTVIDSLSGNPIENVNIIVVEQQTGTITGSGGSFELPKQVIGNIHLQLSSIGYETRVTRVNTTIDSVITILMSQSHLELNEVVVSSSNVSLQNENVTLVVQRQIDELDNGKPNISSALTTIPGVENLSTGTGIGKPVIRGLSGNRIVVYYQKVRIENQQWGEEHALGIDGTGIDNVEVIKGPSSLLYGSDALGGVLYFKDSRYALMDHIEGHLSTKFQSNTLGTFNEAGFRINKKGIKWNLFGGMNSNADYSLPEDGRATNTRFNNRILKSNFGLSGNKWIGNVNYSYQDNEYGITEELSGSEDNHRTPQLPYQEVGNHILSTDHTFFLGRTTLSTILGFNSNSLREYEDSEEIPALDMLLSTFSYNLKLKQLAVNENISYNAGVQGMFQENKNNGEELLIPDSKTIDAGVFVVSSVHFNKVELEGGLRFDRRTISTDVTSNEEVYFESIDRTYDNLNFSAGTVTEFGDFVFRLNISSGFRAPTTAELLSDGEHEGSQRYEIGDPDLKSEKAIQVDLGTTFTREHFDFYISPFLNKIDNYIFLEPTDSIQDGLTVYRYTQNKAILAGGEAGFHWHPHPFDWLHIESGISTVFAEDDNGDYLPLIPAPRIRSAVKGEFNSKGKFFIKSLYIENLFRFRQERAAINEPVSDSYSVVNIGSTMQLRSEKGTFEISMGLTNLFNESYIDHLSRLRELQVPDPGTGFFINAKWIMSSKLNKSSK